MNSRWGGICTQKRIPKQEQCQNQGKQNPHRAEDLGGKLSSPHAGAQHHLHIHLLSTRKTRPNRARQCTYSPSSNKNLLLICGEKEFLEAAKTQLLLQEPQEFLQQRSCSVLTSSTGTVKVGVMEKQILLASNPASGIADSHPLLLPGPKSVWMSETVTSQAVQKRRASPFMLGFRKGATLINTLRKGNESLPMQHVESMTNSSASPSCLL